MRPAKIKEEKLIERLMEIFRRKGYEGTSYADLMKATGLVKASLYHRFPGGKEEMVNALLEEVDRQFAKHVLAPAYEEGDPAGRARLIARRLQKFYGDGKRSCLLDVLSLGENRSTLNHARKSMEFWLESLARIGKDAGLQPKMARKRAEEAVASVEGGLVLARVLGNQRPFLRVLATLPQSLTQKPELVGQGRV
jgi:AcrR family transcriptional regulator